ncbi:hypothetical protein O3P69_013173 [Scylla paramamosain]|uniref:Uncharacterized protein n=1 Tax=Scylla paramamosain TaxID=85552 RepID=A0AAW0TZQ7_SCYPA
MYMNTRANLDYWSTDNCCLRWSLRTGAIIIGFFSLVWQALMVITGVMMLVKCPVNTTTTITTTITTTNITLTLLNDTLTDEVVLDTSKLQDDLKEGDKNVKCLVGPGTDVSGTGGDKQAPFMDSGSGNADAVESNSSASSNSSRIEGPDGNSTAVTNDTKMFLIECPWLPDPETEVLGVYSEEKLILVAGIFIAYSGVYFILSFCVLVGVFTSSVTLLQGWVAFTGFHNLLILATLLVPLPFTTLTHLFLSIAYFILSLYTWAVVKSYMHALKVELNKPLLPEGSITDYTVDGVDVTEIPVQV